MYIIDFGSPSEFLSISVYFQLTSANYAPRLKTGPYRGQMFSIEICRENLNKPPFCKPLAPDLRYLACSIAL